MKKSLLIITLLLSLANAKEDTYNTLYDYNKDTCSIIGSNDSSIQDDHDTGGVITKITNLNKGVKLTLTSFDFNSINIGLFEDLISCEKYRLTLIN